MKKIFYFFAISLFLGVILVIVAEIKSKPIPKQGDEKIVVSASFYPLAEFAKRVGGDRLDVVNITPAGIEAHDYEPTPRDIATVRVSKVFIYQGAEFDPWAEKAADDLKGSGTEIVNMSDRFTLNSVNEEGLLKRDPHIWLDPVLAQKEVDIILEAIKKVDPTNAKFYEENAKNFVEELNDLDLTIRSGLAGCKLNEMIVAHQAFGYFADRYGLNEIAVSGISPEQEVSAQHLGQIAQMAKKKGIKIIFFETLSSPKLAQTIASEAQLSTSVLNPIEGLTPDEIKTGKNYLSAMTENLHNLQEALQCPTQKQ